MAFCAQHKIPVEDCGKLLVATNEQELERMHVLYDRCLQNLIDVENWMPCSSNWRSKYSWLGAILVKAASNVNYRLVTEKMAEAFMQLGM